MHAVRGYVDWLSSGAEAGHRAAVELLALQNAEWESRFADVRPEARFSRSRRTGRSHRSRVAGQGSEEARDLTELIVRHVNTVAVPPGCELRRTVLRSNAWRERANALRVTGDLPGALAAAQNAIAVLDSEPAADLELAMARRVHAFVRHQMNETGAPLEIIRGGIEIFRRHGDLAGELRSRNFVGVIQFDHGAYTEARGTFEDALRVAEEIGDHTMQASLHNNIGHCAQLLGDRLNAADHLIAAIRLFDMGGMIAERPHAAWGLAQLAADSGTLDRALMELTSVAADLLGGGMPLEAARVWLDVAELLVLAERHGEAQRLAVELVQRFTAAAAPREALHAFALLREAASAGKLTAKELDGARQRVFAVEG